MSEWATNAVVYHSFIFSVQSFISNVWNWFLEANLRVSTHGPAQYKICVRQDIDWPQRVGKVLYDQKVLYLRENIQCEAVPVNLVD